MQKRRLALFLQVFQILLKALFLPLAETLQDNIDQQYKRKVNDKSNENNK